jgi:hypothetical protein
MEAQAPTTGARTTPCNRLSSPENTQGEIDDLLVSYPSPFDIVAFLMISETIYFDPTGKFDDFQPRFYGVPLATTISRVFPVQERPAEAYVSKVI